MMKALIFDFSRTLIFPKDKNYAGELNGLHRKLALNPGYDFLQNFELNNELWTFLEHLKGRYKLYLFTSGTIQNAPEIKDKVTSLFEHVFSAEEMGISKREPSSYKKIARTLKLKPAEILFVDDLRVNVEAAGYAGLNAFLYKNNHGIMDYIDFLE